MDRENPLDYETVPDAPRRTSVCDRIGRAALTALGIIWFDFFLLVAVLGFLMRDLANEPGGVPVTVRNALLSAIVTAAIGLPGLAVAVWAQRLGR